MSQPNETTNKVAEILEEARKNAKFEGITFDLTVVNGRLTGALIAKGSTDLPGDLDQTLANGVNLVKKAFESFLAGLRGSQNP